MPGSLPSSLAMAISTDCSGVSRRASQSQAEPDESLAW